MSNYTVAEVQFDVKQDIGAEGKNSDVFIIMDKALNAEMVMKRISKAQFHDPEKYFDEARILYHTQHPNVVEVNYACQDDNFVYITMPYYKNGSLSKYMEDRFLTVREIVRFSVQFLSGLHNIHSNGLLHFDLKPDNVLLSERGEALLSDFGLAKYVDEYGFTTPDGFYVKHVPPEVTQGDKFSTAFDIYQAGLTMYRMCIGSQKFNEQYDAYNVNGAFDNDRFVQDLTKGIYPNRTSFPIHIPVKLQRVILKCLEVSPDDRFEAVIDVVNAMSLFDECYLDWQYSFANGTRTWSKTTSAGMLHGIEVDSNNSSQAFKLSSKGRRTTTASYTKDKITDRDLMKFFKSVP